MIVHISSIIPMPCFVPIIHAGRSDYLFVSGMTATLFQGSTTGAMACVDISLDADSILEGDQVFNVIIDSVSSPVIYITPGVTSVTIQDLDLQGSHTDM